MLLVVNFTGRFKRGWCDHPAKDPAAEMDPAASAHSRLSAGQRMVEHNALTMLLDNAAGCGQTAQACDLSRPAQVKRYQSLTDQMQQQLDKAAVLKRRLETDAALRRSGATLQGQRSIRYRLDIKNNIVKWVAARKERERKMAATNNAKLAADGAST